MAEFTLYTSIGEVHTSTTDADPYDGVRRLFTHDVEFTVTPGAFTLLVRGRERDGARLESYYLHCEPDASDEDTSPSAMVSRLQRFAAEEAGVTLVTDPSVADEAAILDAYSNRRRVEGYPDPVAGRVHALCADPDLECVELQAPSREQAVGLAEYTASHNPSLSVGIVGTAGVDAMPEFDIVITITPGCESMQATPATEAAARRLERAAARQDVEARFDAIHEEVTHLLQSDHVADETVRRRVREMVDEPGWTARFPSVGLGAWRGLATVAPRVTRARVAVVALGVLSLTAAGVVIAVLAGVASLPSISVTLPALPSASLPSPGGSALLMTGLGVLLAGLFITLVTVAAVRSA